MESTRVIQLPVRSQPAHEPELIKLVQSQGRENISGGDAESSRRFASEIQYVTWHARRIAPILGMSTLRLGIVEDREGQTAFHISSDGWHGVVSGGRRPLRQLRESLARG
ncbi:MAG TPA: hypothetical protein DIT13_10665 [Verrucomicrobiales bacterium]|nr:hypothetical protein [Verrucomicrobiales bacterium]HRJ07145.1 hypothetical protein [Prosthecobacter sp.]HRK13346.1 hypothetical protein [Prosthecobacter sp.]